MRRERSPTRMLKRPECNRVQCTCNISSVYHMQHSTWCKVTAQLLSLIEFKLHLFFALFYWLTINRSAHCIYFLLYFIGWPLTDLLRRVYVLPHHQINEAVWEEQSALSFNTSVIAGRQHLLLWHVLYVFSNHCYDMYSMFVTILFFVADLWMQIVCLYQQLLWHLLYVLQMLFLVDLWCLLHAYKS